MFKKLMKLIEKAVTSLEGKEFTLPIYPSIENSQKVNFSIDKKYCLLDRTILEIGWIVPDILMDETDGTYQLTYINYKKNGFGFSQGRPSFCHASKLVGTSENFEELCKNNTVFIIHSYDETKGRRASWFCPADLMNEKTEGIVLPYVEKAVIRICFEKAVDEYYEAKRLSEEQAKKEKLATLGINQVQKIVLDERSSYGGKKEYKFLFSTPVDKETFIKFLDIEGLVTEAHKIDAPICQETVEFYPIVGGWRYKWLGSYTD